MRVIDTHPHIVSPDTKRYPLAPLGGTRSEWSENAHSATGDQLIVAMDQAGVEKAALVHSSTTYGFDCRYVEDAVAAYPKRLTGVFSVHVLEPDAPVKMRDWYAKGLTGMRIYVAGSTIKEAWLDLDDPRIHPCYECAAELGITMALNAKADSIDVFDRVLGRFPQVKFFLDHVGNADFTGGPPFAKAEPVLRMARHPNLYLKITTHNLTNSSRGWDHSGPILERLIAEFGIERLAWGSNYPSSKGTLPEQVALAKKFVAGLPVAQQERFLGGTALSLYPALTK